MKLRPNFLDEATAIVVALFFLVIALSLILPQAGATP